MNKGTAFIIGFIIGGVCGFCLSKYLPIEFPFKEKKKDLDDFIPDEFLRKNERDAVENIVESEDVFVRKNERVDPAEMEFPREVDEEVMIGNVVQPEDDGIISVDASSIGGLIGYESRVLHYYVVNDVVTDEMDNVLNETERMLLLGSNIINDGIFDDPDISNDDLDPIKIIVNHNVKNIYEVSRYNIRYEGYL